MPNPIKVLVCDDHELWRKALVCLLEHNGFEAVDIPVGGSEFTHCFDGAALPDIAILNYKASKPESFQPIVWIRINYPSVKVVISSLYHHRLPEEKFREIGISGLIIKAEGDPHKIIVTLKSVLNENGTG